MPVGYWCPVLHAHLPYVRHPEYPHFLEEDWFFEALTETYIPLLRVLDGLVRDGVEYRLTGATWTRRSSSRAGRPSARTASSRTSRSWPGGTWASSRTSAASSETTGEATFSGPSVGTWTAVASRW